MSGLVVKWMVIGLAIGVAWLLIRLLARMADRRADSTTPVSTVTPASPDICLLQ
ncbi:MAG TPA: hypothetical protein VFC00_40300 [Micromonosporaceae bacterium]|nr:hypothetical protein [Micromonosporaceae bacterium]